MARQQFGKGEIVRRDSLAMVFFEHKTFIAKSSDVRGEEFVFVVILLASGAIDDED